ncbi:hypothetical protein B0T16DRAFT_445977 [Cercophora newfieldiana]|uniref:PLD phosphodiesterase domain-containing protein n=1 Tax=Cercophora newfieldiana TaxID=92897 RepID=A0AA39Y7B4_9PEZI|nr:hypothetical protein B0T16DRAFT_445977 [Cercophora newfieldiana]
MPSINDVHKVIKQADVYPADFDGLTYGITYNDILGLPGGSPFIVLSPFGSLPSDDKAYTAAAATYAEGQMPIQKTFKEVLTKGNALSAGQETLFIDIADLDDDNDISNTTFFTEGGENSIAEAIAHLVNTQVPATVTPVIRFLRGTHNAATGEPFWKSRQASIEAIFWKTDNNGKDLVPRITHPKAGLHVGFYSPNFNLTKTEENIIKFGATVWGRSSGWTAGQVNSFLDNVFKNLTFSASWNHGKIVAIGGKTMMTGGINYWPEYTGRKDAGRGRIIDMQATVTGDAAASAQGGYLDYFWKYLNKPKADRRTDNRSWKRSIPLSAKGPVGQLPWSLDTKVPIFKDQVKYTPKTTGIPVLSVARVGDWGGSFIAAYPVQAVDAARDLYVNSSIPALESAGNFSGIIDLIRQTSDNGPILGPVLKDFKFSTAAWASDTARIWAIQNAKSTVYTSGQMLVGGLQRSDPSYAAMVKSTNEKRPQAQKWDGYLWPYDLLLAFATVIIRLRDTAKNDGGIFIVLGNKDPHPRPGSWGDLRSVADVRARIIPLVRGLDKKLNEADAAALVIKYFHIARMQKPYGDDGPDSIHTKTICVDKELLYVGSDNLYPSYNEEHGIWVDDKPTVADWLTNYWKVLWGKAKEPAEKVKGAEKDDEFDLKISEFPRDV